MARSICYKKLLYEYTKKITRPTPTTPLGATPIKGHVKQFGLGLIIQVPTPRVTKTEANTDEKPTVCESGEIFDKVGRLVDLHRFRVEVERCQLTKRLHIHQSLQVHN